MSFAVNVLRFIEPIPVSVVGRVVAQQMAKSATSVAANYRSVCTARSRAEFVAKLGIVNEEADESVFWLELIKRTGLARPEGIDSLLREAIELRAIFGRSLSTARQRAAPSRTQSLRNDQMTR